MQRFWPALLLVLGAASTTPAAPVLGIFDPTSPAGAGVYPFHQVFTVFLQAYGDLFGTGPSDLYAFNFDLTYDPAILQVTQIQEEGYFAQNGLGLAYNLTPGNITNIGDVVAGAGPGENLQYATAATPDTLVAITFEALTAGQTTLTIPQNGDLYFSDSNGNLTNPMVGSESILIYPVVSSTGPPSVPEPASGGMLAGALLLLGWGVARYRNREDSQGDRSRIKIVVAHGWLGNLGDGHQLDGSPSCGRSRSGRSVIHHPLS